MRHAVLLTEHAGRTAADWPEFVIAVVMWYGHHNSAVDVYNGCPEAQCPRH